MGKILLPPKSKRTHVAVGRRGTDTSKELEYQGDNQRLRQANSQGQGNAHCIYSNCC